MLMFVLTMLPLLGFAEDGSRWAVLAKAGEGYWALIIE